MVKTWQIIAPQRHHVNYMQRLLELLKYSNNSNPSKTELKFKNKKNLIQVLPCTLSSQFPECSINNRPEPANDIGSSVKN